MKKMMILLSAVVLLVSLMAFTGCGEKPADEGAAKADATVVATHDCEGGCGMTDMPADKTTEIDGKFYCTGCAKHMQEENHEGHDHGGHSH